MTGDSKKILRGRLRALVKSQNSESRALASLKIAQKLFLCEAFKEASYVGFYVSLPEEVDTAAMIDRALELGKRVAVPRCDLKENQLEFYEIKNRRELKKGVLNILEPKADPKCRLDAEKLDCVIVPGVAFDRDLNRLGRGRGFYDRFLSQVPKSVKKIGLAFSFQVVPKIPVGDHDVKLDFLITD